MKIIDEETGEELEAPDMENGYIAEATIARPGAYETIDNKTKFALDSADYEAVLLYHRYTDAEKNEMALKTAQEALEQTREEWEGLLESFFSVDSLSDLLKLLISARNKKLAARRAELRKQIADIRARMVE